MARHDRFVDHLHQVGHFAAFSCKDLQKVAERSEDRRLAAGTTIVNEGDNGDGFFVIIDGTARGEPPKPQVRDLGPGIGFGGFALLLENAPRNATVVAEGDMEFVVGQREFAALLDEVPCFAARCAPVQPTGSAKPSPALSSSARKPPSSACI